MEHPFKDFIRNQRFIRRSFHVRIILEVIVLLYLLKSFNLCSQLISPKQKFLCLNGVFHWMQNR